MSTQGVEALRLADEIVDSINELAEGAVYPDLLAAVRRLAALAAPAAPTLPLTAEQAYAAKWCGTPQSMGLEAAGLAAAPTLPARALAQGIASAALKAGIINGETDLTGPHLLMLCDDLANAAIAAHPSAPTAEKAAELPVVAWCSRGWDHTAVSTALKEAQARIAELESAEREREEAMASLTRCSRRLLDAEARITALEADKRALQNELGWFKYPAQGGA